MSLVSLVSLVSLLPLRADRRHESLGLDVPLHGEEAYTSGEGAILVLPEAHEARPALAPLPGVLPEPLGGEA
jgi:Amt family ammonium transporter